MLGRAARDEIGFGGLTSPKSLDRVLEFLICLCDRMFRCAVARTNVKNTLQADVLELTPFRETEFGV